MPAIRNTWARLGTEGDEIDCFKKIVLYLFDAVVAIVIYDAFIRNFIFAMTISYEEIIEFRDISRDRFDGNFIFYSYV